MKKITSLVASSLLVTAMLSGCAGVSVNVNMPAKTDGEHVDLIVFAAASMTETLEEIRTEYEKQYPDTSIIFNFDSSGTLKTQIEEGADCDVFISAAPKQMDQLDITADAEVNPDGLDFIDSQTRIDLLENKVVLAVPKGNPANVNTFAVMAGDLFEKKILLAMGNEDVPVGQYTQKILKFYDLDEAALAADGLITYGSNVKEVTAQVAEGAADCGILYSTDAYSAGLKAVDTATEKMCGKVIYPAAVLKGSKHSDEAKAFLAFLQGKESKKIFEKVGFTCLR